LFTGEDVLRFHQVVRSVPIAEELVRYAVRLAAASRPAQVGTPAFVSQWINWGAGLRAAQFLVLGAKARALFHQRVHVTVEDLQALIGPTFRHRILLSYRAEADGVTVDQAINRLLETVPKPISE
jgi:MoxR-like ATPase